ncbi:Mannosyl-oligosaccharide glucosidase GCS1 [Diplonema papillatum]|nr:Mannosyl-oligosaccharide glucosidase GCS1 [Diplonema papillatum]
MGGRKQDKQRPGKKEEKKPARGSSHALRGAAAAAAVAAIGAVAAFVINVDVEDAACRVFAETPRVGGMPVDTVRSEGYNRSMLWGSYRPQVYFGLRSREEESMLFGFGWGAKRFRLGQNRRPPTAFYDMRYTAEDDASITFGWNRHDGRRFGVQNIEDRKWGLALETSFVKHVANATGQDPPFGWTARVRGSRIAAPNVDPAQPIVVAPVFSLEQSASVFTVAEPSGGGSVLRVYGETKAAGRFVVTVASRDEAPWRVATRKAAAKEAWRINFDTFFQAHPTSPAPNQLVVWKEVAGGVTSFEVTVTLSALPADASPGDDPKVLDRCRYSRQLAAHAEWFEARVAEVYGKRSELTFHAVSNLLGGMGYWYGEAAASDGTAMAEKELFSAVPSRAKFPRGFLWDEGFHQLVVGKWCPELAKDVLLSWLAQVEPSGWIPREQIRGAEPRSRVPPEFVAQNPAVANPPTLLLPVQNLAETRDPRHRPFLVEAWPFLKLWHAWLNKTQAADSSSPDLPAFQWKGKNGYHLLPSGLDDYPRSRCDTPEELHVDLHSWMILLADTMHSIAVHLRDFDQAAALETERKQLRRALFAHHWDADKRRFADVSGCPPKADGKVPPKHVSFVGYVTLFPLLCGALDPAAHKEEILSTIALAEKELLTEYGLRSLSASSLKRVKKHDNYWTGPIWLNINYMFVRAIDQYGYSVIPEAAQFRDTLRRRLLHLVSKEYDRTGKLWENYDPSTGEGRGTAPFTGWTTLVTLL